MPPAVSISARRSSVVTTTFSPAGWAAPCGAAGTAPGAEAPGVADAFALGTSPCAAAPLAPPAGAACCVLALGKNIDAWPLARCQLS